MRKRNVFLGMDVNPCKGSSSMDRYFWKRVMANRKKAKAARLARRLNRC
jgi:hypothetical protein